MSKKRYLDGDEIDAVTGPDRVGTYGYLYQTYNNSLSNYKNAIKQLE